MENAIGTGIGTLISDMQFVIGCANLGRIAIAR